MADNYLERLGLVELPQQQGDFYDNDASPVSAATTATSKGSRRKSARNTTKSDDESKKSGKRGRPRVDPQDESAVERRRTQIRLAQRAYRERKETTISGLEKRVLHLQNTIGEMTQAFLEFNEKADQLLVDCTSGLGQALHTTTQRFLQLSRSASEEDGIDEERPKRKRQKRKTSVDSDSNDSSTATDGRRISQTSSDQAPQRPPQPEPKDMLGYQIYESGSEDLVRDNTNNNLEQPVIQNGWHEEPMELQSYRVKVPESPSHMHTEQWKQWVDQPLKPVYTYNFQESSFARRLLRYTYEKTYHLLSTPSPSPAVKERIQHILRYTLCFSNPELIADALRSKLLKSKHDPLEQWNMPELHIGGAGLHFPREDDSTTKPSTGYELRRNVGPWPITRAGRKEAVPVQDYPFDLLKFADVEGVWFDSYDVEQYLKTKGLFLDGHSPTAIMELEDNAPPSSSNIPFGSPETASTDSLSTPQSPLSINEQSLNFFMSGNNDVLSTMDMMRSQHIESLNMDPNILQSAQVSSSKTRHEVPSTFEHVFNGLSAPATERPKKRAVIDVDRLLEVLNDDAVCLGRAPGFRLENVDAALETVLQESW